MEMPYLIKPWQSEVQIEFRMGRNAYTWEQPPSTLSLQK